MVHPSVNVLFDFRGLLDDWFEHVLEEVRRNIHRVARLFLHVIIFVLGILGYFNFLRLFHFRANILAALLDPSCHLIAKPSERSLKGFSSFLNVVNHF